MFIVTITPKSRSSGRGDTIRVANPAMAAAPLVKNARPVRAAAVSVASRESSPPACSSRNRR